MTAGPSRRRLLAAVATAPALALAITPVSPVAATELSDWHRLRGTFEAARAAADRYHRRTYKPFWDEVEAATGVAPSLLLARTARDGTVRHVRIAPGSSSADYLPGQQAEVATILDNYRAWWARFEASEGRPDWTAVRDQMDRLFDAEEAARRALMAKPAPDGEALAYKVSLALESDELAPTDRAVLHRDAVRVACAHSQAVETI